VAAIVGNSGQGDNHLDFKTCYFSSKSEVVSLFKNTKASLECLKSCISFCIFYFILIFIYMFRQG